MQLWRWNYIKNKSPLILNRAESYIGVMVDDLITKSINEPYRMFTSRSEHRLSLRAETAPFRLGPLALKNNMYTDKQKAVDDFENWKANLDTDEKDKSHMGGNFINNLFGVKVPSLKDLFKGN